MHPQAEQEVNFLRKFLLGGAGLGWRVGVVNLAVLAVVLRTRLKKVINFLRKKRALPRENTGCAYGCIKIARDLSAFKYVSNKDLPLTKPVYTQ